MAIVIIVVRSCARRGQCRVRSGDESKLLAFLARFV